MDFEEFKERIKADLPGVLPAELKNAAITSEEVEKLQGVSYIGIVVKPEKELLAPTINITTIFQKYELGMSYEGALSEIAKTVERGVALGTEIDISMLNDYSKMRENLCVQVVETDIQSILITNHLLDVYGITAEQKNPLY